MKNLGFTAQKMQTVNKLPVGAYVVSIGDVRYEETKYGDQLVLRYDIAEGEYQGYFAQEFKSNTYLEKKWKGTHYLRIPDESYEYFETQKHIFENFIACIEESNSGYKWNWDETTLKGKRLGLIFREEEFIKDGEIRSTVRSYAIASVDDVRNGRTPEPKPKRVKPDADLLKVQQELAAVDNEDCPF